MYSTSHHPGYLPILSQDLSFDAHLAGFGGTYHSQKVKVARMRYKLSRWVGEQILFARGDRLLAQAFD